MLESINKFVPVVTPPVPVGAEARIFNNATGLVVPIPTFLLVSIYIALALFWVIETG